MALVGYHSARIGLQSRGFGEWLAIQ